MGDRDASVTHAALAAELLNSNLKNYAGVRLRALPPVVRGLLLDAMCDGARPTTVEGEVELRLAAKTKIPQLQRPPPPAPRLPPPPRPSPPRPPKPPPPGVLAPTQ